MRFLSVVAALAVAAGCTAPQHTPTRPAAPEIITMAQWGGLAMTDFFRTHDIRFITLHHGGEEYPPDKDTAEHLRNLQSWSRREKKWIDLPYHFLIDWQGKIYAGRDLRHPGDTNTAYDPTGHALICVLGNFELQTPNGKQLRAMADLMAWLCRSHHLSVAVIKGHKDVAEGTACPGKNLYRYLSDGYFKREVARRLGEKID
ncbi:MAG: peptidoglycan recognition protein family protein [candidate division KSB1 bacterium]|nr:peptidoglycan recognition protein family protein [candidate division KSB1 bacterium]MDZ7286056.1 peptidoglycan recognition protein family protein [candidate division KSB1 bacterium]MDZ7299088.1 peptidoglycan recognition protein family protein [candidate division KSB1 bacterium]MDZ7306391.1 peptidoglycan recognition protein family protein [candidate division KSB1 bacterium]MDZ7349767.1 peptidoglycan recognition protein family protein [candidate division KSB1 bacterium]